MSALRILENCSIASRGFARGEVAAVGADLTEDEARALIKWRRAEPCEPPAVADAAPDKPARAARTRKSGADH